MRGLFEVFVKGIGEPICVTRLNSAYNNNGNTFANSFAPNVVNTEIYHWKLFFIWINIS